MKFIETLRHNARPLTMILAMCVGVLCYKPLAVVDNFTGNHITPMLIFGMLFVTFCKVRLSDMHVSRLHITLLVSQIVASVVVYYLLCPMFGVEIAQGGMICFLAPIAMGAVVIGGLLGANVASIASYSLLCNFTIAVVAPYILSRFGNGECTFAEIMSRVVPLLIMPFVAAQVLRGVWSRASQWIGAHGGISFYLWMFSMVITLGRTTSFVVGYEGDASVMLQVGLGFVAFCACVLQFVVGRVIGRRFGEAVTAGQSLGQKNTVLAVWMAHSFLSPIASIAPTAYIIWQNLANSLQIYLHDKKV